MAKYDQYELNYEKLYPGIEIRPEILAVLKQSDRKMKYIEVDLKTERVVQNRKKQVEIVRPSREQSFERMCEEDNAQFASQEMSPEDTAIRKDEFRRLHCAIQALTSDEAALIYALYFDCIGEREYAKKIGISQRGVNKRRNKALDKLRKMLREK